MTEEAQSDRVASGLRSLGLRLGLSPDRRGLVLLGVLTTLAYVALAFCPDRSHPVAREAAAWATVAVLLLLYGLGDAQIRASEPLGSKVLLWFFALTALVALLAWPFHSADLYLYANGGWLESHYGLNPYAHVPTDVPADPMLTDLWKGQVTPYGFLFAHLSRVLAWLGGGNLWLTVRLYKAVNVLALCVLGWLVASTARRLGQKRSDVSTYLLLASPFLLVHHVVNGHNDILMALFVVLGLRLAIDGRWAFVAAALVLGVLVKLAAAVALPFAVVFLAKRHGWARTVAGLAIGGAVLVLVGLPYLLDARDFRWDGIAKALTSPAYSLHAAVVGVYRWTGAPYADGFQSAAQLILGIGFLGFLGMRVARAARKPAYSGEDLITDAVLSLILLTCVASSRFGPWYGGMFLPVALLLPDGHSVRRLALWLTAFELLGITFIGRARILDALVMTALPLFLFWLAERRHARIPSTVQ